MDKPKLIDFSALCSIYENVKDNSGRFVDRDTGECIQQMSIRDFCLTDRWRPAVEKLRALRSEYGAEAKKRDDYIQTKAMLPGATLSGLFALREVYNERTQRNELKSRITANLHQHTGFLCIDIDAQDNTSLASMTTVLRTLRHRPEVALIMKSCSGTGYFALIPLEYPQRHKEQFAALLREYTALGIHLDRQCGDVTRVRFASYDEHPYINDNAIPYAGLLESVGFSPVTPAPRTFTAHHSSGDSDDLIDKVDRLVKKIEQNGIDITNDYGDWFRIGFALANLPSPWGRQFFHRVSAICGKYDAGQCDRKFNELSHPQKIGIGTFFNICKDYGITLGR